MRHLALLPGPLLGTLLLSLSLPSTSSHAAGLTPPAQTVFSLASNDQQQQQHPQSIWTQGSDNSKGSLERLLSNWMPPSLSNLEQYEDHTVAKIAINGGDYSPKQRDLLLQHLLDEGFDIWRTVNGFVDIRASQEQLSRISEDPFNFLSWKDEGGNMTTTSATTVFNSLADLLKQERDNLSSALRDFASKSATTSDPDTGLHSVYHPYASIESLLNLLATDYPDFAKLEEIGKTSQGRSIHVLRISDYRSDRASVRSTWRERKSRPGNRGATSGQAGNNDAPPKRKLGFSLLGGQHAREWISPATLLYIAHALLAGTRSSSASTPSAAQGGDYATATQAEDIMTALGDYEFHFIPVANPDGYVYSWEHDRLWQRSRQGGTGSDQVRCQGIDLNRNWGYKFEKPQRANPCSDLYPGTEAFQAVELKAISDYLTRVKRESGMDVFVDFHSFGQMLMFPYSYSCNVVPPDAENLFEGLLGASKAIRRVHGQTYEVGSVCDVSYTATGQALDWTYHEAGIRWSFTFNLRDQGVYAFLLPPDQIVESGQEMLAGVLDLAEFIAKKEKIED